MNIAVIVIDTLRTITSARDGNDWIKTPNLDKLAAESWVFDRAFAASYPTIPHRTDALTGRYGGPFHTWGPLRFDVPTLPRALAEQGYCTQLIHDTPHLVNGGHNFDWPFHAWTPIRGAEVDRPWIDDSTRLLEDWCKDPLFDFVNEEHLTHSTSLTYVRANRKRKTHEDWNAAKLFIAASEWLNDNRSRDNFFLWLDCFDPHEPWDAPPEFVKLYDHTPGYDGRVDPRAFHVRSAEDIPEAAANRVKAFYAAKVSWVDHWLGRFLNTLEETGLAKKTAVLLTADHGTSLGERGHFHKGYPVREQEGHVPFLVRVPGAGAGRSKGFVQPQDIFATVMAIAGANSPDDLDSHDVLAGAREGKESPRELAVSGTSTNGWGRDGERPLFTAFDAEWSLEVAMKPENCRLTRLGAVEDVAAKHPDVVGRVHADAIGELERRGADPAVMAWLRSEGALDFPADCRFFDGWPLPPGYEPYFSRLCPGPSR